MNEWAIFGVIVTVVTFIIAVCKPLISLTKAITELTVAVKNLQDKTDNQEKKAHDSHCRLWDYNDEQDKRIDANREKIVEHDNRLLNLERK